jgi:kynurenine formamidase
MPILDLTQILYHQMPVFPGEEKPSIVKDQLPEDASYVTFRLESNMHTGTHIDAPYHANQGTRTIDTYPLDLFVGKAKVIDARGIINIAMRPEWGMVFKTHEIILFCTGHDRNWNSDGYYHDYPVITDEVALALKEYGVRIAGVDSPSPDKSPFSFHRIFLNENRFLIENLTNLDKLVNTESVEFMAFPLKIQAEASLIRAVARY